MKNIFDTDKNDKKVKKHKKETVEDKKLTLRKEELDISKNWVKTGDVELGKEIIEEQKIVDVPVTHEEVVVERRSMNEPSDSPIDHEQSMHIPVNKEIVNVDKHTIVTGEVDAYKNAVQEVDQVSETLKKEREIVKEEGETHLKDEERRD